jgi:hypothetical protein
MDPEALFFAFYYQPDTYQQYLAAQVGHTCAVAVHAPAVFLAWACEGCCCVCLAHRS